MSEFRFKQFTIRQDKTAMKVGTDGVLLGAWSKAEAPKNILDIGTGTGLIAVMLAQKYHSAKVDAVEIEKNASEQATQNAQASQWHDNITVFNEDFILFSHECFKNYDLIVSNPPFFEEDLLSPDNKKNLARHTHSLPLHALAEGVNNRLALNGKFSTILPYSSHKKFIHICAKHQLFCNRMTFVRHTEKALPKRVLLEFSHQITFTDTTYISLKSNTNEYSSEFKTLTKDYYLNF